MMLMRPYRLAVSVKVLRPYVLEVTFDDGAIREIDLEGELRGEVFEPLKDPKLFALAAIDTELGTVTWPNGADLAPEFLFERALATPRSESG